MHTYFVILFAILADCTVLCMSMVIVMGPTPPGTGVSHPATGETLSKSTSPQSFPAALRFIPVTELAKLGYGEYAERFRKEGAEGRNR